jgi:hypothetical protein
MAWRAAVGRWKSGANMAVQMYSQWNVGRNDSRIRIAMRLREAPDAGQRRADLRRRRVPDG